MYMPNQFLEKAVAGGDDYIVRGAITGIIRANPCNENGEVDNAVKYAEEHGIMVFDEKNDPALEMIMDESKWTREYYATAVTYLQENFTRARLAHVLVVSKKTHPAAMVPAGYAPQQLQGAQREAGKPGAGQGPEASKKDRSRSLPVVLAGVGVALAALVVYLLMDR